MKKIINTTLFSITLAIFISCKGGESSSKQVVKKNTEIQFVKIDAEFSAETKNTRANIVAVNKISKDIIEVIFNYSGGCKEHEFYLITTGGMIKTLPPKISLYLVDKQEDDHCRMLITDTIIFNIRPIIPPKTDSLLLLINNGFTTTWYH
jgi:hypothetical protein